MKKLMMSVAGRTIVNTQVPDDIDITDVIVVLKETVGDKEVVIGVR